MTGKPKRVSKYAKTREEAVKLLNQMSFMNDTSPNNFTRVTLGDWLDLCLEVYMKNTIKQSTYLSYESYIRVHLKPALGDVVLQELTPRMLQLFYNYKAESEGLSAKTIVNLNLFLHRALKFAVAEGYINSNPASSVNLPSGGRPQITILTRDEQMCLIQGSYAFLKAQETGHPVELCCAIGDDTVDGRPYSEIVEICRDYIRSVGGFEKFAEWGLV